MISFPILLLKLSFPTKFLLLFPQSSSIGPSSTLITTSSFARLGFSHCDFKTSFPTPLGGDRELHLYSARRVSHREDSLVSSNQKVVESHFWWAVNFLYIKEQVFHLDSLTIVQIQPFLACRKGTPNIFPFFFYLNEQCYSHQQITLRKMIDIF